ncbi:putative disease resistance RPP13-like protein 1 isoform X1 [Hevea brasiliensis]|uniref:putative disease resistance RPP13-like protein 1 isoform X1 n=1 Tax=Hevea brasiliensis TaxID=3981 RepID=UPI0025F0E973|nr:putative disease resistance RPP13-like protein 1 isoform X1 [Hevea brasiliensis]
MAGALVGGAFLSAFLQVLFDRIGSREVLDFFRGRKLNDGLLNKLNLTLNSVNGVLDDAEEKQITRPNVKIWVDELKDAVYDAEDLLDEIAYEVLRTKLEAAPVSRRQKVRNFFSCYNPFKKGVEAKLEEIVERLENLVKQKDVLGLIESAAERPPPLQNAATTSLVDESGVYGRKGDKEAIMKLLQSDNTSGKDLDVISIVGMGGLGKTTLAQLVYNDNRADHLFDLKAWVCVSKEFNIPKITKDILEEVTGKTCEIENPNRLQLELKKTMIGKKVLIVLDDVWNDKITPWEDLLKPLKFVAQGSKIIVTTRNESVAVLVCTLPIHHLKELTYDDCWSLFAKYAFDDSNVDAYPNLEEIGREIVKKCKGLPLAAKTLGSLLHSKRDVEEWEKISRSDIWNLPNDDILPVLRLSYYCLPSHLKRCFAYCAIFPKDYEFKKEELVFLWMAEGFLAGGPELENAGSDFFSDLVSRSFFQRSSDDQSHFVMHDLKNDLAKSVSGEFCFRLNSNNSSSITRRTRHLSYARTEHDGSKKFEAVYEAEVLRTFLPIDWSKWWWPKCIDNEVMHDLLPKLKRLRVLSLSQYHNIIELPDSFGKMKHLRYLDLSGTPIKRLPESVNSCYSLQTLILYKCKDFEGLPTNMSRLVNLCHLDIRKTKLKEMPKLMSKLTRLQKLTDFIVGEQSGSSIKELGELQHLRGKLCIWNLQNVVEAEDALQANLKDKKHLKKLKLRWAGNMGNSLHVLEQLKPHKNIECLSIIGYESAGFPSWVGEAFFSNIVSLRLDGCINCSSLPPLGQLTSLKELGIIALDKVVTVSDEFYGSCTSVKKPFGCLEILRFERMEQWCEWFSYKDEDEGKAFPLLRELYMRECPKLMRVLPSHLPSLTTLEIEGCQQLMTSLPRAPTVVRMELKDESHDLLLKKLPSGMHCLIASHFHSLDSLLKKVEQMGCYSTTLEEIGIENCESLERFPLEMFPKLKRLDISGCPNLKYLFAPITAFEDCISVLEERMPASYLTRLCLRACPNLAGALPSYFPFLTTLVIIGCQRLMVSLPKAPTIITMELRDDSREVELEELPSGLHRLSVDRFDYPYPLLEGVEQADGLSTTLEAIEIRNYDSLECLPLNFFPTLKRLNVYKCPNLVSLCATEAIYGHFTFLSSLEIWKCPNLVSFPKGGLSAPNLAWLLLWDCENLKSLPECMHSLLPSLVNLKISHCPELQSFPDGGLPSRLESLEIISCDKLIAGCLEWNLQLLPSLSHFCIGECKGLKSFPKELLLPSTLTSLKIVDLQSLEYLDDNGLQHLSSLRQLQLRNCPNLRAMPREGLLSSLASLSIWSCPWLELRCQPEKGEDWPKISHIPNIQLSVSSFVYHSAAPKLVGLVSDDQQ